MQLLDNVKFDDKGLIPAVIVNVADNRVLTLCFMNKDALEKTVETGKVQIGRASCRERV